MATFVQTFANALSRMKTLYFEKQSLKYIPEGLIYDKLAMIKSMAWCHQATSHYLHQI